jgi:hypothetical protein
MNFACTMPRHQYWYISYMSVLASSSDYLTDHLRLETLFVGYGPTPDLCTPNGGPEAMLVGSAAGAAGVCAG